MRKLIIVLAATFVSLSCTHAQDLPVFPKPKSVTQSSVKPKQTTKPKNSLILADTVKSNSNIINYDEELNTNQNKKEMGYNEKKRIEDLAKRIFESKLDIAQFNMKLTQECDDIKQFLKKIKENKEVSKDFFYLIIQKKQQSLMLITQIREETVQATTHLITINDMYKVLSFDNELQILRKSVINAIYTIKGYQKVAEENYQQIQAIEKEAQ